MKLNFFRLTCIFLSAGMGIISHFSIASDAIFPEDTAYRSTLPVIRIETGRKNISDKHRTVARMKIENLSGSDTSQLYNGKISIEVRGSSSKKFPKKSYSFSLVDQSGRIVQSELLGLPAESDWILYAPYSDKSLLRDVVAYKMYRDMNRYTTRTVFVELFLDNRYNGVYILEEKIKRSPERINTGASRNSNTVTGGYILRIDRPGHGKRYLNPAKFTDYVSSQSTGDNKVEKKTINNRKQPKKCDAEKDYIESSYAPNAAKWQTVDFHFFDPPADSLTEQQKNYLCNYLYAVETSMMDPFPSGKDSGYHRFIDLNSFIDYFILSEVTRNIDSYRLSTYFYKLPEAQGGKMVMGPVWDFNLAFGNADYCDGYKTSGWAYEYNYYCNKDPWLVPFWWERLIEDPVYRTELKCRWLYLRNNTFSTENILSYIDEQVKYLDEAPHRNFRRWPILGKDIWPNKNVFKSYPEEINFLKQWITERLDWLDRNMPGDCTENTFGNTKK